MDPLTAKLRFKFRTLNNWLIVIVIFVFVAVFDNWVADALAMAALFYLYFFILDKRPIRLRCGSCENIILSNTPWVCGFCKQPNKNANEHPFVDKCAHCGSEPKAYKCHHTGCGELVFLTEDKHQAHYAYCLNSPDEAPKPDERAEKMKTRAEKVQDKEHEIQMAELKEILRKIKERSKEPKVKSRFDQKKESFDDFYDGIMGMREYARKKRAEAAETYKNDPESLKDANDAIDEFLRRNT
jgi:hypothetical protein